MEKGIVIRIRKWSLEKREHLKTLTRDMKWLQFFVTMYSIISKLGNLLYILKI